MRRARAVLSPITKDEPLNLTDIATLPEQPRPRSSKRSSLIIGRLSKNESSLSSPFKLRVTRSPSPNKSKRASAPAQLDLSDIQDETELTNMGSPVSDNVSPSKAFGTISPQHTALLNTVLAEPIVPLEPAEIQKLYLARLKDQGLAPDPKKEERFLEVIKKQCCGDTFCLKESGLGYATAAAVADVLEHNTHYSVLDFSGNRLRDAGVEPLARVVTNNTTLTRLDLRSNDIGPSGGTVLFRSLSRNTTLTSLDIGGMSGVNRNHIGPKSMGALADALRQNTTLTSLSLESNGIGAEGVAFLCDGLCENTSITDLNVGSNAMGPEGMARLCEVLPGCNIERLILERNDIGDRGASSLAGALRMPLHLTVLNLASNRVRSFGVSQLCDALKKSERATLAELDLDGNDVGREGAVSIASLLRHSNCVLSVLTLSKNGVDADGAEELAEALRYNRTLTKLDLSGNNLGDQGARALAIAMRTNAVVTHLDLSLNRVGDEGAAAWAVTLRSTQSLQNLSLKNNIIRTGFDAISEALKHNASLLALDTTYNDCSYKAYSLIESCLRSNRKKYELGAENRLLNRIDTLKKEEEQLFETQQALGAAAVRRLDVELAFAANQEEFERESQTARTRIEDARNRLAAHSALRASVQLDIAAKSDEISQFRAEQDLTLQTLKSRQRSEANGKKKAEEGSVKVRKRLEDSIKAEESILQPLIADLQLEKDRFERAQTQSRAASASLSGLRERAAILHKAQEGAARPGSAPAPTSGTRPPVTAAAAAAAAAAGQKQTTGLGATVAPPPIQIGTTKPTGEPGLGRHDSQGSMSSPKPKPIGSAGLRDSSTNPLSASRDDTDHGPLVPATAFGSTTFVEKEVPKPKSVPTAARKPPKR